MSGRVILGANRWHAMDVAAHGRRTQPHHASLPSKSGTPFAPRPQGNKAEPYAHDSSGRLQELNVRA